MTRWKRTETQAALWTYASAALRFTGDGDYIAARLAHRHGLDQQFLWQGLQCVEKYLKAILLFNLRPAEGTHNLDDLLAEVKGISEIDFTVSNQTLEFIEHLDVYGINRYLVRAAVLPPRALQRLDETIWDVRRYCQPVTYSLEENGVEHEMQSKVLNLIKNAQPFKFKISSGRLEKIISTRSRGYEGLTWKNKFYGQRRKRKVSFRDRFGATSPIHAIEETHWKIIQTYIKVDKASKHAINEGFAKDKREAKQAKRQKRRRPT